MLVIQLIAKLFDTDKFSANQQFAPNSLVIFCRYQKHQQWKGIDIGIGDFAKVCNDFYPIPSHVGTCITKGIDIGELMKTNKNTYHMKVSKHKLDGSTRVNIASFVIDTNWNSLSPRTMYGDAKKLQLQIHSPEELAQILYSNQEETTKSVTLEAGYEYTFHVSVTGQIADVDFKKLDLEQRISMKIWKKHHTSKSIQ